MNAIEIDLAELQREIAASESRLAELRAVEKYIQAKQQPKDRFDFAEDRVVARDSVVGVVELTLADAAEKALQFTGGPTKVNEIVRLAIEHGWIKNPANKVDLRNRRNSMYGAMSRTPNRFRLIGPGTWDLITRRTT